ncbi:apolipoprotein A-I, partial [Clarias magur]
MTIVPNPSNVPIWGRRVEVQLPGCTLMHSVLFPPPRLGPIKSPPLFDLPSLFQTRIINSFMMKFLALALAILLAAGCQADAPPTPYEHYRSLGVTFLQQAKEAAERTINHLDDDEFKDL